MRWWQSIVAVAAIGCSSHGDVAPDKAGSATSAPAPAPSAPAAPARLSITLDDSFPAANADGAPIRAQYQRVANDTLAAVRARFEGVAPVVNLPISLGLGTRPVPHTYLPGRDSIRIELHIPPELLVRFPYAKFVYQLSHELGHVMFDIYRSNGLVETLCDALSYQILDDLARTWPTEYADDAGLRAYAPYFHDYRVDDEQDTLKQLPEDIQHAVARGQWADVTAYLKQHRADLEHDPYGAQGYALRSLGAMVLLSQPVPWRDFVGIARLTTPGPERDPSSRDDLPIELDRAPAAARRAIAAVHN